MGHRAARTACSCGRAGSDRHQLLFLRLDHFVDVLDRGVGELLDVGLGAAGLVLGNLLVLQQLLDVVVGVAADVADGDLGVLAAGVDVLSLIKLLSIVKRAVKHPLSE